MTRHPLFSAEKLMEEVKTFAELSSNIVKEIELKRQGEWGKRLLAERVEIGKVMESFMDRAPREVAAALPMQKATGADFSKPIGAGKARNGAALCPPGGGQPQFRRRRILRRQADARPVKICGAMLKRYNEDLVKALKAEPRNQIATAQFAFCTELTAILFSEEEAELLRRARAQRSAAACMLRA